MGDQAPLTLQQLAIESLLKEEPLAFPAAVAGLPRLLFPAMLEVAFRNNQTNILPAMVLAWPFTCLPVGSLMKTPHLETLKALLDGLDMLLTEEACPRRGKIRVLDLTDVDSGFWSIWTEMYEKDCSHQDRRQKKPVETCPCSGVKKYLHVVTDLKLVDNQFDECAMYLWEWAQQRKGSVHLCCQKLEILDPYLADAKDILQSVDLPCIRELKVRNLWIEEMAPFGSYLGQMRSLHTLMLEGLVSNFRIGEAEELEDELMNTLFSQLPKLHCLQHLYVDDIYVLVGSLAEWLRCLQKPLETLSITFCRLTQRDLDYLPQCLNLSGLKHLYLSKTLLFEVSFEPLGKLLERVKDTLQTLVLKECLLEDSAFNDFMPALSQCSQLLKINFVGNELSLSLLKQLLHHTAKLNKLTQEVYPVPLECYDNRGLVLIERFDEICPELLDMLKSKRQPKAVSFVSTDCPKCGQSCVYDLESRHCLCWR
ncbi:hypothetical protein U0070_023310 [Myodes glareolus]|uniref:Uncharacterized protein n=1 Tax=Myodes glareolus TaxID=447135 RepID=A0AAW0HJX0_MYOGA